LQQKSIFALPRHRRKGVYQILHGNNEVPLGLKCLNLGWKQEPSAQISCTKVIVGFSEAVLCARAPGTNKRIKNDIYKVQQLHNAVYEMGFVK